MLPKPAKNDWSINLVLITAEGKRCNNESKAVNVKESANGSGPKREKAFSNSFAETFVIPPKRRISLNVKKEPPSRWKIPDKYFWYSREALREGTTWKWPVIRRWARR